ncbi:MAG: hypothetical protein HUN04_04430 [Desulfobacter sp.]|nr:MAG: hypothetical protein HUN04_04430 [Desulfobacter sp.]
MSENEQGKRFVDVYSDDKSVVMRLWDDDKKICYVTLPVRPDEEKYYEAPSETGEMISVIEPDFLDDFVPDLQNISFDEMKTPKEIIISPFEKAEQGKGIYMVIGDGKAEIKLSLNGKDTVFETFNNVDELDSFIFNLENAIREVREED